MSSEIAIKVDNLSKCYQIYGQPHDRLKQFIIPRVQGMVGQLPKQYFREFWAVKDISFEVRKGEIVGIIGRNASGKSTLLQMICGTLNPTGGSIQTHGRIAALLELGSGFNPEFTGRENVYMNAAVLGLNVDEVDRRFNEIISFADIGDFIERPIKTYSSGMTVRLAFSVAVHVDSRILIVDEALAVGDIAFQHKCFQKIEELRKKGVTILLVSHDLGSIVEFCNRVFVMDAGVMIFEGLAHESVNKFKQLISLGSEEGSMTIAQSSDVAKPTWPNKNSTFFSSHPLNPTKDEYGDGVATIFDWGIVTTDKKPASIINNSEIVEVLIFVRFNSRCNDPIIGYFITDAKGREIVGTNTLYEGFILGPKEPGDEIRVSFKQRLTISPGEYFLNIGCSEYIGENIVAHHRLYRITTISIFSSKDFVGFFYLDTETKIDAQRKLI